ncbi:MAG TPA: ABC transporter ATP-binding protein [Actinomycetes bacterium]|nr:ABC transporter ATP-binding protein [Actinomycetes bacterium]
MGTVSVVEVQGLSKHYGSVQALRSVDVTVERGCTGLVGSNGAGKSTLLKLLLGLIVPDQGRATVLGRDVAGDPLGVRAAVGYLPEGACLPADVTAADFVAFMGQLGGLPPRAARERASEVCYQVGLDEERYRALGGFSTGMLQRVKLAAALVHDPRLLLLDEPTDGMDPQSREDMLELIDRARGELDVDVLVSTHLLGDVERICDRVVMVHAGQVLVQGPIAAVAGTTDAGFAVQLGGNGQAEMDTLALAGLQVRHAGEELQVQGGTGTADVIRDVAAERGWALRRLSPRAPSLEETFLRLQAEAPVPG